MEEKFRWKLDEHSPLIWDIVDFANRQAKKDFIFEDELILETEAY